MYSKSERSILKFGMIISAVVAVLYLIVTILIATDPVGMYTAGENFIKVIKNPFHNSLWRVLFAATDVLNIGFIAALSLYISKDNEEYHGIINWCTVLAYSAMVAAALNWIHFVHVGAISSAMFYDGVPLEKILDAYHFPIDSYFIWTWGIFGLYMLIANSFAFGNKVRSDKIAVLGILSGVNMIGMVVLYALGIVIDFGVVKLNAMIIVAGVQGGIIAPIYHLSFAKYFKRALKRNTGDQANERVAVRG